METTGTWWLGQKQMQKKNGKLGKKETDKYPKGKYAGYVNDPLFLKLVDVLESCSENINIGVGCQFCRRLKKCVKWFNKLCDELEDTFLKAEKFNRYIQEFEGIRTGNGRKT